MINKNCIGCGSIFTPKWSKARYCSISCSKIGNKNPNWAGGGKTQLCLGCKKEFTPKFNIGKEQKFCSVKCSKTGYFNPQWKGDNAGYSALHFWVERNSEKPSKCECCGKKRKLDAANISGEYKRDISDWEWLCRKCHMTKDGRLKKLIERNREGKDTIPAHELREVNPHLL